MRKRTCLLTALSSALVLVAFPLAATNWYVLDGGAGAFNCTDWANACDDLDDVNYARGDTVYVADGSYAGHTFDIATSGTTLVTIKKAIESDHGTDTGWSSAYGDGQAQFNGKFEIQTSYLLIDGQVGFGAPWWKDYTAYGFFVNNPNGGPGQAAIHSTDSQLAIHHLTFRHLELQGPNNGTTGGADTVQFISSASGNGFYTFSYLYMHAVNRLHFQIGASASASTNMDYTTIEYVFTEGNGLTQGTGEHSEQTRLGPPEGTVRWSVFTDHRSTGGVLMESGLGWEFYGNVFWWRTIDGEATANHGVLGGWTQEPFFVEGTTVCNNTVYAMNGGGAGGMFLAARQTGTNYAWNNLWVDSPEGGIAAGSHDYNAAYNSADAAASISSESNGQALGSDPLTDPDNGDFTLSYATEHGDSTGICASYNTDMDGNTRGADGVWDRGAFEFNEGVPQALRVPIRLSTILGWILAGAIAITGTAAGIVLLTRAIVMLLRRAA